MTQSNSRSADDDCAGADCVGRPGVRHTRGLHLALHHHGGQVAPTAALAGAKQTSGFDPHGSLRRGKAAARAGQATATARNPRAKRSALLLSATILSSSGLVLGRLSVK